MQKKKTCQILTNPTVAKSNWRTEGDVAELEQKSHIFLTDIPKKKMTVLDTLIDK